MLNKNGIEEGKMAFHDRFLDAAAQALGLTTLKAHEDGTYTTPVVTLSNQQALGYYSAQQSFFKISPTESPEEAGYSYEITQHFTTVSGKLAKKSEITSGQIKRLFSNVGKDSPRSSFTKEFPEFRSNQHSRMVATAATLEEAKAECLAHYQAYNNFDSTRFFAFRR